MIPIEAVERWRKVQGALDTCRIHAERERQVPERNVQQREADGQRVEGPGAETGNRQQDDQQAIAVDERQARGDDCEHAAADQQYAPRAQQRAEVHGQRADEHRGGVERGADPRALVDADAEVPSEIGEAQRKETCGQTRDPGAHDDARGCRAAGCGKGRPAARTGAQQCGRACVTASVAVAGAFDMVRSIGSLRLRSNVTTADNPDRNRVAQRRVVERDLDRHALHDFREIAGRVVRWQERELRSAGRRDLEHSAAYHFAGIHIDADVDRIADLDVGQLRLAEIRLYPRRPADEGQHLRAGDTSCPGRTCRSPTVPSAGATMRV